MLRRLSCPTPSKIAASFLPTLATSLRFKANKETRPEDVAHLIEDGATIAVGGFVATGAPEAVLEAIGQRFLEEGHPKNCTVIFEGGPGDFKSKGINHLAKEGLIKRSIGSHYGQVPMLGELALANKIEAYNFPMGSISRMIRAAASKAPGHITSIGFGTMVDPKNGGGKINSMTPDLIEEVQLRGQKYLFFPAIPIDVAIVRGTTADTDGNISMEREALLSDHFLIAQAATTNGGLSIAQVERVAEKGSIPMRTCFIPGAMIDAVVVAPPEKHFMSYVTRYNPAATGEIRKMMSKYNDIQEFDERKVIARRAAMELAPDFRVNLGIGMPEGVAKVAAEEKINKFITVSTEAGAYGGVATGGHDFGPAENANCLIQLNQQFDFYNGGGLDICFLGLGECDPAGNVNVTRLGRKLTGPGGFVDISQATQRVNLVGTFTAGAEYQVVDGKMKITKEGNIKKFVKAVREITFSGARAVQTNQKVKYITERCVFELINGSKEEGVYEPQLLLREVAPGISVEKDILPLMDFKPVIPEEGVREMAACIFDPKPMGLLEKAFVPDFSSRAHYAKETNTFYVNLSNVTINSQEVFDNLFKQLYEKLDKIAAEKEQDEERKMHFVINYNRFEIDPDFADVYRTEARKLNEKWALSNRRFSSRAFRRHQMGAAMNITESFVVEDLTTLLKQLGLMTPHANHVLSKYKPGETVDPSLAEKLLKQES